MPEKLITRKQLVRLQTLWSLLAKHEGFDVKGRALRLAWVAHALSSDLDGVRSLGSFRELSEAEARVAIDKIQECLPPELVHRRGRRRRVKKWKAPGAIAIDRAREAPTAAQLELLAQLLAELGRTREWLDRWLQSGRTAPCRRIATRRDAQRVLPALKNMIRNQNAERRSQNSNQLQPSPQRSRRPLTRRVDD